MTRLIQGGEVLTAIDARAVRARDIGYDNAIRELGFDPSQLRTALARDAQHTLGFLPLQPTVGDVLSLVSGQGLIGFIAGVRLGRMYAPEDGCP